MAEPAFRPEWDYPDLARAQARRIDKLEEAVKSSLLVLCAVEKTYGSQMHDNFVKDLKFAIEACRNATRRGTQ